MSSSDIDISSILGEMLSSINDCDTDQLNDIELPKGEMNVSNRQQLCLSMLRKLLKQDKLTMGQLELVKTIIPYAG